MGEEDLRPRADFGCLSATTGWCRSVNTPDVISSLGDLTGTWRPVQGASPQDLRDARLALADGLAAGTFSQTPFFRTQLPYAQPVDITAAGELAQPGATSQLVNLRSSTDAGALASAVTGPQVSKTLGPFADSLGVTHWVDLIPLALKLEVVAATGQVLGYLLVTGVEADLGGGSLWIDVGALHPPLGASGFAGLSFSGGTVTRSGSVTVSSTQVIIGAGGSLGLDLHLAPPSPAAGLPGLGRDAEAMQLALPASVTVVFSDSEVTVTEVGDSSATVYGTSFSLTRNQAAAQLVTAQLDYLVFPCDASTPTFAFGSVLSADVVPSGQGQVQGAGWALPITTAPAGQLGQAASAGAIMLTIGRGTSLAFGSLPAAALAFARLTLQPGVIAIAGVNGAQDVVARVTLWNPVPPASLVQPVSDRHASEVDLTLPRGGVVFAVASTQLEGGLYAGRATCNVDRPLAAAGTRLALGFGAALIVFLRRTDAVLAVSMSGPTATGTAVIALENALLRVNPAVSGALYATYGQDGLSGTIELIFDNAEVLPILPDPYASGNGGFLPVSASLAVSTDWTPQNGPQLRFTLLAEGTSAVGTGPAATVVAEDVTTLLDVSGNADQFGVSFEPGRLARAMSLDGLALAGQQELLTLYALPGISWEPVVDDSQDDWLNAPSPDDGPPVMLRGNTVTLVRVEPTVLLPAFARAGSQGNASGTFTLPFGLVASLIIDPSIPAASRPAYSLINAQYASGLSAARQLSIRAESVVSVGDPALPGNTTPKSGTAGPDGSFYGELTLGTGPLGVAGYFEQEFSAGSQFAEIPVSRIDISGYGTSMFSDWHDPDLGMVGVRRARFEVLRGRTAFEVVQIVSVIIPHCVRFTRTIIFDRLDTGLVVRHDTGPKPIGVGRFEILHPAELLLGPVQQFQNVHNITATGGPPLVLQPPVIGRTLEFVPVTFDADVVPSPSVTAISNGNVTTAVAATQIQGYAQTTVGNAASDAEILAAMQQIPGGVTGVLGCVLNVGPAPGPDTPRFSLNISALAVKATSVNVAGTSGPALAVAMYGTPRLPRDGAWSVTRRQPGQSAPAPVDPTYPLPLVFASNNDGRYQWRLLEPEDALSAAAPATTFGLLQGVGTSKSLFENTVIDPSGRSLLLDPGRGVPPPLLADVGALLGAAGIFPDLGAALQIPAAASDAIALVQDGFSKTFKWTLSQNNDGTTPLDDQSLLDLGIVSFVLQYQDTRTSKLATATFAVDATAAPGTPRWSLEIDNLAAAVFVSGFGTDPLLTIHGTFKASELQKAGFTGIQIDYGSALAIITNLLQGIESLVESIGGSVDLDVGFSDNKLTVRDGFALPTLPLGLGELEHIAVDLGLSIELPSNAEFTVGLASQDDPFTWIVDPFTGNGAIVLGTSAGEMNVFMEAGIGLALALDVAVASGSASIVLDFTFQVQPPSVMFGIALTGNATVDVLDGLASASLTLTATIDVSLTGSPPTEADFYGSVGVGIHISIAWVINVDFDGQWGFNQSLPLPH
jgi:hypothetical protein